MPSTHLSNDKKIAHAQSGTARAALLGLSDGLVTNVSLILGVAGAGAAANLVRLAGFAGLIAGALSMAVGEYISMRGQIELLESVLVTERQQLRNDPETAHAALEQILLSDGVLPQTAHKASLEIARDPEKAMAVYARGQLGVNLNQLGSAWGAAVSSLGMFSIGAAVPLLPWLWLSGLAAIVASVLLAVASALAIGAYLGYATGGRWLHAAVRQLIVLILAAGATYCIGRLFHAAIT